MRIIGLKRLQCCSVSNATSKLSKFSWRILRFVQRCRVNKNQSSFSKMHFLVLRYFALAVDTFESGGLIFSLFWDIYQNPMKVGDVRQGPNHGGGSNLPVFLLLPPLVKSLQSGGFAWNLANFGTSWYSKGGTLIKFAQIEPGQG